MILPESDPGWKLSSLGLLFLPFIVGFLFIIACFFSFIAMKNYEKVPTEQISFDYSSKNGNLKYINGESYIKTENMDLITGGNAIYYGGGFFNENTDFSQSERIIAQIKKNDIVIDCVFIREKNGNEYSASSWLYYDGKKVETLPIFQKNNIWFNVNKVKVMRDFNPIQPLNIMIADKKYTYSKIINRPEILQIGQVSKEISLQGKDENNNSLIIFQNDDYIALTDVVNVVALYKKIY